MKYSTKIVAQVFPNRQNLQVVYVGGGSHMSILSNKFTFDNLI